MIFETPFRDVGLAAYTRVHTVFVAVRDNNKILTPAMNKNQVFTIYEYTKSRPQRLSLSHKLLSVGLCATGAREGK